MRVRYKNQDDPDTSFSNSFNVSTLGEVIVQGEWGADSAYIKDLDILINGEWKDMRQAFADKDIIPDNYNQYFGLPMNQECKERGYNP